MKNTVQKYTRYYDHFREFLNDISDRYGEKPAITTYGRGGKEQTHSYRQLAEDSFLFGQALCAAGLAGKHIALVGENSYEWIAAYFGIAVSGSVSVCIDIEHSDETMQDMIFQADAEAIVSSASMAEICSGIAQKASSPLRLIVIRPADSAFESFEAFCEAARNNEEAGKLLNEVPLEKKTTASIVFTSGTTSTAKPVMLSHHGLLRNVGDSLTLLTSGERVFGALPLYHTYGITASVMCPLIRGLRVCVTCDLKRLLQEINYFVPHTIVAVPLIIEALHKLAWSLIIKAGKKDAVIHKMKLEALLHRPFTLTKGDVTAAFHGTGLENLNVILSGGAYLEKSIPQHFEHFGIIVLQGYGITECSPSISCNCNETFDHSSVGPVLPSYEVKIKDDEILVRGEALMNGYYKAPELTRESYEDGWFKTGDLGYINKKGHLVITGRKKNLIVMKNGKKVSAEEMENEIRKMPLVKDVMVYGAQSGVSADDVKIAAMIYPDAAQTEHMSSYDILERLQRSIDQINSKLPTYKQIQMVNIRETDFDRTSSKKIKRHSI